MVVGNCEDGAACVDVTSLSVSAILFEFGVGQG